MTLPTVEGRALADLGAQLEQARQARASAEARAAHLSSEVQIALGELVGDIDQQAIERETGIVIASRASWWLTHGEHPGELFVCHACDNPPCVNPAHLWLGDYRANALDAMAKGRLKQAPTLYGEESSLGRRTHCANGHELVGDNVRIKHKNGWKIRVCRTCQRDYYLRSEAKQRGPVESVPERITRNWHVEIGTDNTVRMLTCRYCAWSIQPTDRSGRRNWLPAMSHTAAHVQKEVACG